MKPRFQVRGHGACHCAAPCPYPALKAQIENARKPVTSHAPRTPIRSARVCQKNAPDSMNHIIKITAMQGVDTHFRPVTLMFVYYSDGTIQQWY
ncbi:MAG: hypothetical protein C5B50_00965 [Verrucomicrobia bacterium]|nr:MAG: hypothetical protein C5B50_00965 [Verrucomicrobiota bacterium]